MLRWIHILSAVLLAGAVVPGGAGAWQWALTRTIPSPGATLPGTSSLGFGSAMASLDNALLVGNPVATGGLSSGAAYLIEVHA